MRVDPGGAVSENRSIPYGILATLACLSALFVLYGSLLPFEYRDAPPGYTFGNFSYLNWTNPENYNQVDWVTNLILYVPIGFFAFGATSRQKSGGAILAALLGASLAICIEFLQIWAAPRTASLNDIVANIIGAGAGILGWGLWGRLIVSAVQNTLSGGPKTLTAGLGLYLLVYSFIALFPFDFLVSADEVAMRLADPNAFAWVPENLFEIHGLASLILKIALMMPLGMAIKLVWNRGVASAVLAAFVLTSGIEALQWLQYSGRVEASSFAVAMLGAALGHQITDLLPKIMLRLAPWLKAGIWLAAPLYLAILPVLRGWHAGFAGQSKIEDVLASMHWMPFHYYYFITVPHAFSSLLSLAISYAPLGIFIWAIRIFNGKAPEERPPLIYSAFLAIIFAGIIEAGGLITTGLRPDLTNILIAVAAVTLTQRICEWAARVGPDVLLLESPISDSNLEAAPQDRPLTKRNAHTVMNFATQRPAPIPYGALAMLACLSAIFVLYGSLLPFEYRDAPAGYMFGNFSYLKWYGLGLRNRADLVANLILYVPIGFFAYGATSRLGLSGAIFAAFVGIGLAVCIEFLQVWAAPRTYSLNDMVAEIVGTGIGILGWALWGRQIVTAIRNALSGGPKTLTAALGLYLLGYIFIALFPFDFLVSADEIATRLADPKAFVWAPENLFGIRGLASLILQIALILPLGMAIRLIWNRSVSSAVLAAFALTCGIEALQWLQYSGRVEASSFAVAMLGAALGHQITDLLPRIMLRLTPWLKAGIWLAAPLYLAILPVLRGWHAGFAGQGKIEDVLASMHWMPFYYYYFTTEQEAFSSLMSIAVSYAPLGVFIWAIQSLNGNAPGERRPLIYSAFWAIIFAGIIEAGGLITTGLRPDLTNILIAVAAVTLTQRICEWAVRLGSDLSIPESNVEAAPQDRPFAKINAQSAMHFVTQRRARIPYVLSLLAITIWFVVDFPVLRLPIAAAFTLYAIFLWRRPGLWLIIVPAMLPVFDLAPWSGRFFFDEFDALVLLTAGVLALRENGAEPLPPLSRNLKLVLTLLAVSYLLSTLLQLWPPPPITPNSFADYFSPYNSLRVGKGFVWALLLFNPLRRAIAQDSDATHLLLRGLLLGLFGVSVVGVYEHWIFAGLFEWNSDHRIAATFSSLHTGDGPIDVWLATTMPLLAMLLLDRRWWALLPVTIGMGLLSFYTLMATASRGPLIAVVIAFGVGMLGLLASRPGWRRGFITVALGSGAVVLISMVGLPMLSRTYMGERFEGTMPDAETRYNHWRAALSMRDDTLATKFLGMGLGSFPRLSQESRTIELRSSRTDFIRDGDDGFMRMWSGLPQYMGQAIHIDADNTYQVSVRLRTSEPNASLTVALCDKWLISSYNCTYAIFQVQENGEGWQTYRGIIKTGEIGYAGSVSGLVFPRPTRLSFWVNNAPLHGVDIDAISITKENEINLVANGEFDRLSDHWFWTSDAHLFWHTKNLAVGLLIDQGWLGLLAVGALLALTLAALARQIAAGDRLAAVLLASLTGFLITGMTVSTFDQPRLVLMFYILCLTILLRPAKAAGGTNLPSGNHSGQSSPAV